MEYLAPGVYVEEVASGNKPIAGASTSTAALVGVTARGPVNQPTLVTSFGEFSRVFGGLLNHLVFTDGKDALPYAAQGFFNNGGQRVYVSRIVGPGARFATADMYAVPASGQAISLMATRANAGSSQLVVDNATNIDDADHLLIDDDLRSEYVQVTGTPAPTQALMLTRNVAIGASTGDTVVEQTVTDGADLSAEIEGDMNAGGQLMLSATEVAARTAGEILRISDSSDPDITEYVTIAAAATVDIEESSLAFDHPQATTTVHVVTVADGATSQTLTVDANPGDNSVAVDDISGFSVDDVVQINGAELAVVRSIPSTITLNVATPLVNNHGAGVSVQKQVPMLQVRARYQGLWGNTVQARTRQNSVLITEVEGTGASINDNVVTLKALFGINAGSYVAFSTAGVVSDVLLVVAVNRATNEVTFEGQFTAAAPAGTVATSLEYDLIVERIENEKVVEAETFESLGMHPNHFRYGPKIVGSFDRSSGDASDSGESSLVRLSDLTFDNTGEPIAAALPNRASMLASLINRPLASGTDDLDNIDDLTFIGSPLPGQRSGIHSLQNEESISMVAVPGQTSVAVQKALIGHCEYMRYRFAVIETPRDSNLANAITHRQNFDTTRAAIYYPWLVVADQFGEKGDLLRIAPSGHVMGIYARTDTSRGVWKAPANEVVRGILQFESAITKGEQDILNPININAFRDFRTANRGLRLWGARTLSSDASWKYVSVRRLFLFLEQSIERGLQYAVFEPNNENLWAGVKQSISSFLATVWRNGGLEGVKEEEAFFVNVGYNVTMTQADIDNGRLIVEVGVAAVKPAEFVIIRIGQKTREATA